MKNLYLIVGKSGTGKTTEIEILAEKNKLSILPSYTTRPKRTPNEKGHIFISKKQYIKNKKQYDNDMVAYTYFADNHYFATIQQLIYNDLYITDIRGVEYLKDKVDLIKSYFPHQYHFEKGIKIIYIDAPITVLLYRLIKRDGIIKGIKRFLNDIDEFSNSSVKSINADYVINNIYNKKGVVADMIWQYIQIEERK